MCGYIFILPLATWSSPWCTSLVHSYTSIFFTCWEVTSPCSNYVQSSKEDSYVYRFATPLCEAVTPFPVQNHFTETHFALGNGSNRLQRHIPLSSPGFILLIQEFVPLQLVLISTHLSLLPFVHCCALLSLLSPLLPFWTEIQDQMRCDVGGIPDKFLI